MTRKTNVMLCSLWGWWYRIVSHLVILGIITVPHVRSTFSPQCNAGIPHTSIGQEWVYTAPPRFVPLPPVDPNLQMEFYQLFMSYSNQTKFQYANEPIPPGLSQDDFEFINSVCPKDAFFYSMSPMHVTARLMLQNYLELLPTASEVLRVSRIILYTQDMNPKIWYYALMGAVLSRPDMSGVIVPQPLDVLPDMFVPAPVLSDILSRYKVVYGIGDVISNPIPRAGPSANLYSISGPDSFSYQHVAQSSEVREQRVKFNRKSKSNNTSSVPDVIKAGSGSLPEPASGEFGKRIVRYRRGKKKRKSQRRDLEADDPTPAESISSASVVRVKFNNGNKRRRTTSTSTTPEPTSESHDDDYGDFGSVRLMYGEEEEDDEYDELKRIHESNSNSSVKAITQRILSRRQRRMKKTKVKRQAFGSPFHNPSQPIRGCTMINGTIGASNGPENKLWYWREDLMANQHHWYWHQMYPVNATLHGDRRAELFFFTHRNFVARYNAERLSNGMPRTTELLLRPGSIIEDGYNPFLIDMNSKKFWTPRDPHVVVQDVLHADDPDFAANIFLKDLHDLWYKLLFSIKDGHLLGRAGQPVPIQNYKGIDKLANTIEATQLSVNPFYYNSVGIHNLGHNLLGLSQDPQYIARTPTGVMAETMATMRDPVFYTFHAGIDNLFDRYKRTLPPYQLHDGDFPLVWEGVAISSVLVLPNLNDGHQNKLRTFWSIDRFPLESGVDNSIHNGEIKEDLCALHLNHEPFTFKITVNVNPCVKSVTSKGTVRIFMAPRYDEFGQLFPLKVQRRLMFQLDAFPAELRSGPNIIIRRSTDSSLTKPWAMSLREQAYQAGANRRAPDCGCGWPGHLLIPKGTPQGMHFDLFVMITNFDEDIVQNPPDFLKIPEGCTSAYIMCGVPWRRYPDRRPMGYPFDRVPYKIPVGCRDILCKMIQPQLYKSPQTLEEYVRSVPNMATTVVNIQHFDTIVN